MRFKTLVAALAVALPAGASVAASWDLGTVGSSATSFGSYVWQQGDFRDHYTFRLAAPGALDGGTMAFDSFWGDLGVRSVSLQRWTGSGWSALGTPDASPGHFSFANLSGGQYRLEVAGSMRYDWSATTNLLPYYTGTIRSIASAAPEPGALAMMLAGLVGVGLLARRRRG